MKLTPGVLWNPPLLGGKPVTGVARGVDRITVSYQVRQSPPALNTEWDREMITAEAEHRTSDLGMSHLHVTVTDRPGGLFVRIDMTPAYLVGWTSNVLVPPDSWIKTLIVHAIDYVEESLNLSPAGPLNDIRLTRLDLTRNIHLSNPVDTDLFLRTHAEYRPTHIKTVQMFIGPNGATYVEKANNSRSVTLYDKHAQTGGTCPPGTIRWECKIKKRVLQDYKLGRLGDLSAYRLYRARHLMWVWSGMNTGIAPPSTFLQIIRQSVADGSLPSSQAVAILGHAALGPNASSVRTRQRHRKIIGQLGVTADLTDPAQLFSKPDPWVLRTDFSTGSVTRRRYE